MSFLVRLFVVISYLVPVYAVEKMEEETLSSKVSRVANFEVFLDHTIIKKGIQTALVKLLKDLSATESDFTNPIHATSFLHSVNKSENPYNSKNIPKSEVLKYISAEDFYEILGDLNIHTISIQAIKDFKLSEGHYIFDENEEYHGLKPKDLSYTDVENCTIAIEPYLCQATERLIQKTDPNGVIIFLGRSPQLLSTYFREFCENNANSRRVISLPYSDKANHAQRNITDGKSTISASSLTSLFKIFVTQNRIERYFSYLQTVLPQDNSPVYIVDRADSAAGAFSFMHLIDRFYSWRTSQQGGNHCPKFLQFLEMGSIGIHSIQVERFFSLNSMEEVQRAWHEQHPPELPENILDLEWKFPGMLFEERFPADANQALTNTDVLRIYFSNEKFQVGIPYCAPYRWNRVILCDSGELQEWPFQTKKLTAQGTRLIKAIQSLVKK